MPDPNQPIALRHNGPQYRVHPRIAFWASEDSRPTIVAIDSDR